MAEAALRSGGFGQTDQCRSHGSPNDIIKTGTAANATVPAISINQMRWARLADHANLRRLGTLLTRR